MNFWNVIKEVSAQPVRQEADRLFVLALAGDPAHVAAARAAVLGPNPSPEVVQAAAPYLYCASPPYTEEDEKRLRHADLLVSLPGGPGLTDFRPADAISVAQGQDLPWWVLQHRPDLRVALGRRLPGFRAQAAEQVICEVSRVNAEYAAIAGVSTSIPFLAPFFPAVAGADLLVLTKNQVFMTFRLAAIYGEDLDLKSRAGEVLGVLSTAFGWRTLARQVVGRLPGPWSVPVRVAVAYSGTYAVGRAAQKMLTQGRRPSPEEMRRIYVEAAALAKDAASVLLRRIARPRKREEPPALPPPGQSSGVLDGTPSQAQTAGAATQETADRP